MKRIGKRRLLELLQSKCPETNSHTLKDTTYITTEKAEELTELLQLYEYRVVRQATKESEKIDILIIENKEKWIKPIK